MDSQPTLGRPGKMHFDRYDYAAFMTFFCYAAGSVAVPVCLVLIARDLGFSLEAGGMTAGGGLHLGRTVLMVVAMLVCGFAAGRWGNRRSLGVSVAMMAMGVALCAIAPSYTVLLVALLIAGFGEGVIEGLGTPFVQDLHPDESGRYINFAHSFWSIGVLVTVLISAALLSVGVSWRILVGAVGLLGFVAAAMLLIRSRKHPCSEHLEPVHWIEVCSRTMAILRRRRFWLFFVAMFVAGGGEFCLTFWCASFIQLNFVDAAWAGAVGTAIFAAGMVIGRTGASYFIHQNRLKHLIVVTAIAGTGITLLFPYVHSLWLIFVLLFFAGLATAPFWPSVQGYAVDRLKELDSTMLLVLLSCAGVPGCGVFTWLMGVIGDRAGLATAFYLVPICYAILAALIGYEGWIARSSKSSLPNSAAQ